MLILDLQRVFDLRGINRPAKFLIDHGFSKSTVTRLINYRISSINMKFLEKLCIILKCTPNDLLRWTPGKGELLLSEDLPLNEMKKNNDDNEFYNLRTSLSLSKLEKVMHSVAETGTDKKDEETGS
jgi:DNA-binding Xre family transcriptional regulator